MTYTYSYPCPSVTATIVPFAWLKKEQAIVVGIRGNVPVYPGMLCCPGGFLNAKTDTFPGETVEQCALRELYEEFGLSLLISDLELVTVISDPSIDPRGHVVNVCYFAYIDPGAINVGDDIVGFKIITLKKFHAMKPKEFAFNHFEIIMKAIDVDRRIYPND